MSGGPVCVCPGSITGIASRSKNWVVYQRRCNFSAFNGYHRTPSAYSGVRCTVCGKRWRTRAAYVDGLPDGSANAQTYPCVGTDCGRDAAGSVNFPWCDACGPHGANAQTKGIDP